MYGAGPLRPLLSNHTAPEAGLPSVVIPLILGLDPAPGSGDRREVVGPFPPAGPSSAPVSNNPGVLGRFQPDRPVWSEEKR